MKPLFFLPLTLAALLQADNFIYLDGPAPKGSYHPHETVQKPEPAESATKTPAVSANQHGYFIQTGAFHKMENVKVHEGLMRNAFGDVQTFRIDGYYKVMVGPYATEKAALAALPGIRHVSRDAFLTRH